jgi:tetratricopeptide (TPR) repeat protein
VSTPLKRRRAVVQGLLAAALVLAGLVLRAWVSSGAELAEAEAAQRGGDLEGAIAHYRRAAAWYFPGNARAAEAIEALFALGEAAEARGETTLALAAFRSVRAASMSARSVYVPHDSMRRAADERIAALMATGPVPPLDANRRPEERRESHLALLRAERDPNVLWAMLALVGLVAWVTGGALLASRGLDARDAWVPAEARRWGTLIVLGLGLFVLGLALA